MLKALALICMLVFTPLVTDACVDGPLPDKSYATTVEELPCVRPGDSLPIAASLVVVQNDGDVEYIDPYGRLLNRFGHVRDNTKFDPEVIARFKVGQLVDQRAYFLDELY